MRIHSKLISAVLLTAGLLVGQPSAQAQIQGSWPKTPGTTTPVTYAWDGLDRTARIHLPTNYSASGSYAVVLAMHGGGGTASHFENLTSYSTKSDAEDFIVVYPQGVSNTWNASHNCCGSAQSQNVDDVGFLRNLVTDMLSAYPIDPGKVFATGHSNGGVMTWRLGCDAADLFAAIGPNAADSGHLHDPEGVNPDCDLGGNKVSVVNLHGEDDSNMPYYGGAGSGAEPYVRQPVEDPVTDPQNPINQLYGEQTDIGLWTGLNGCAFVPPVDVDTQTGYEKTTWCAAGSGVQVVNYRMIGDGHVWFTTPNSALSSTDVTWAFFENATPPPPPPPPPLPNAVPSSQNLQLGCTGSVCRVPIRCDALAGTSCSIEVKVFVPKSALRHSEDPAANAQRRLLFAAGVTNIPAGQTANVRLRLRKAGKQIARTSTRRRIWGVMEIRNSTGTVGSTGIRIRLPWLP